MVRFSIIRKKNVVFHLLTFELKFLTWETTSKPWSRFLILDVSINDSEFVLLNLWNGKEKEQIKVLNYLFALLTTFNINPNNRLVMTGNLIYIFNSKLDAAGRDSTLKRKYLAELIKLKEACGICDIRKIRNKK